MSTFAVTLEVGDPSAQRFEKLEAIVDTGATYTVIPASVLQRLGVQPHRKSVFEYGDGSQAELDMGRTWVRLDSKMETTLVVFGEEGVEPLLGAVTLEEFLLAPDPVRQQLIPVHALMMGFRSRR